MTRDGDPPGPPTLEEMMRRLQARLTRLFRSHGIAPMEAGAMLESVLTVFLYRYNEIADPEAWIFEALEHRLRQAGKEEEEKPPPSGPADGSDG